MLYDKYFATGQSVIDTILAVIRSRLSLPPLPVTEAPSPSIFGKDFTVIFLWPGQKRPKEQLKMIIIILAENNGVCFISFSGPK